ncbi:DivIVA domain-containing protein [Kineococcus terrestris]|uniref:DivIVA domain-containing protein n=1 Tax=Kineococcus terrestris TaxID=2044856 RepID=UPI0034DAEF8F
MPLSPEDVVNKRFNPTRVREGYAQDEVDDFLDEVVAELRRLNAENEELRAQLDGCREQVAELSGDGSGRAPAAAVAAPRDGEVSGVTAAAAVPDVREDAAGSAAAEDAAALPSAVPAASAAAAAPVAERGTGAPDAATQAAGVIALAQRLHDEYVRDGEQQRDALVSSAQEQAARVVADAEEQRDRTLGDLETRRERLEAALRQLHGREDAYRRQLEDFMTTQLTELRRSPRAVPDDAVAR